jgi:hypothetical protein
MIVSEILNKSCTRNVVTEMKYFADSMQNTCLSISGLGLETTCHTLLSPFCLL